MEADLCFLQGDVKLDKAETKAFEAARGNARLRIEQWAKNPSCVANTISVVRNVRMVDVALSAGLKPTFGQSPFAIARGQQFENALLRNSGQALIAELQKHSVLPEGECQYLDLRTRQNGGKLASLDVAVTQSRDVLSSVSTKAGQDGNKLPLLCAGFTLKVPKGILLPEAILIVDVLVIKLVNGRPTIIVGEVKTYPDRGGHTDASELASARAQAGMYVHGLDLAVHELGLDQKIDVSRVGMLILTRPGSNHPSVRANEDLRYQTIRAQRGFEMLEKSAMSLGSEIWAQSGEEPPQPLVEAIINSEKAYCEGCLAFCDLAPLCFDQARQAGNPIILGEAMQRFLGEVNLHRAVELLEGHRPKNEAEANLLDEFASLKGIPSR